MEHITSKTDLPAYAVKVLDQAQDVLDWHATSSIALYEMGREIRSFNTYTLHIRRSNGVDLELGVEITWEENMAGKMQRKELELTDFGLTMTRKGDVRHLTDMLERGGSYKLSGVTWALTAPLDGVIAHVRKFAVKIRAKRRAELTKRLEGNLRAAQENVAELERALAILADEKDDAVRLQGSAA